MRLEFLQNGLVMKLSESLMGCLPFFGSPEPVKRRPDQLDIDRYGTSKLSQPVQEIDSPFNSPPPVEKDEPRQYGTTDKGNDQDVRIGRPGGAVSLNGSTQASIPAVPQPRAF